MKLGLVFAALSLSACSIFGSTPAASPGAKARIALVVMASAEATIIRTCAGNIRNRAANGDVETAQKLVNTCNKYVVPVAYAIEAVSQDVDAAADIASGDTTYNKLACVAYSAVQNFSATAKSLNALGVPVPQEINDAVAFVGELAGSAGSDCNPLNPNGTVPAKPQASAPPASSATVGESL